VAVMKQYELGLPAAEIIRKLGIAEQTFYRWKWRAFGPCAKTEALDEPLSRSKEFAVLSAIRAIPSSRCICGQSPMSPCIIPPSPHAPPSDFPRNL
jgi:hypothetical protein